MKRGHGLKIVVKALAWLVFGVVFVGVIVFVGVFHLGFLEFAINNQLKKMIAGKAPLDVRIGAIEGDFFNYLVVTDVRIDYDDGAFAYQMAEIPRIDVSYSLTDLWRGQLELRYLKLDSLQITVLQDSTGAWAIPQLAGGGAGAQGGQSAPSIKVHQLIVEHSGFAFLGEDQSYSAMDLKLDASVEVFDRAYSLDLRQLEFSTDFNDTKLLSAAGKFTLNEDRLVFQGSHIDAGVVQLSADGYLTMTPELAGHIELKSSSVDMPFVGKLIDKGYSGGLSISGGLDIGDHRATGEILIEGDFQGYTFERVQTDVNYDHGLIVADQLSGEIMNGCAINGGLRLDLNNPIGAYRFEGEVQNLNLTQLTGGKLISDLSGAVTLDGEGLSGHNMRINTDVTLSGSSLDRFYATEIDGSMIITTDSLRLHPGFRVNYYENVFRGSGLVRYAGDVQLKGSAALRNLDRFDGKVFIEDVGGRAQAAFELSGSLDDPNIVGRLYSDSLWLYEMFSEKAWYEYDIDQFLTARQGSVNARVSEILAWDFPLDSLAAVLIIDSNIVTLDSISVVTGEAQVQCSGELDYFQEPIPVTLPRCRIAFADNAYSATSPVRFDYDTSGITFHSLPLASDRQDGQAEEIAVKGRVDFTQRFALQANLVDVQIAPWVSLVADAPDIGGKLSCAVTFGGDVRSPEFFGTLRVDSARYFNLAIGDIISEFHYAENNLRLDTAHLKSPGGEHSLIGDIPLSLRFDRMPDTLFPGPQRLEARSYETSFDIVSFILPQVERLDGLFEATATITGTPPQPQFTGLASLSDGRLKIYELEIPADSLELELALSARQVLVTAGACRFPPALKTGRKGKFRPGDFGRLKMTGSMEILGIDSIDYDLKITGNNLPLNYTLGAFVGKADVDSLLVRGVTPPTVTGDVRLISGLYEEEFLEEDAGYVLLSQFEQPDSWNMDINVELPSTCVIRNTDIDANFTGTANARRDAGLWSFVYDLEVVRGRVFLTTHTFQLDQGGTVVNSDYAVNDPDLNLTARTNMRIRDIDSYSSDSPKSRKVIAPIRVTGTLENPIITYFDDPSLSAEQKIPPDQLYANLATGYQLENLQAGDLFNRSAEALANMFSTEISRIGARTIGVETFEIDPDLDLERTEVTLGFYPGGGKLYLYGTSDIGISGGEIGFEAYLMRYFQLQGKRDDRQDLYSLFVNFGLDF